MQKLSNPTGLTWEYRLTPDGFEASVIFDIEGKQVTIVQTMPWHDFLTGLTMGWRKYHQENTEYTKIIFEWLMTQSKNNPEVKEFLRQAKRPTKPKDTPSSE